MEKFKDLSRLLFILIFFVLINTNPAWCQGLHGYIGSYTSQAPARYTEGFGFYSAIWPLISEPIANFQIGLPSTWIMPDNTDNTTTPLCPEGTRARNWTERGPTWSSVFQTVEGGPGYWVGNKFHYGPPKFKMNSTPNCYDNEISTPGWQFFWSDTPLPDDLLGIAQLSNRLLIPPDGLTFEGNPNGELLGVSYMALPLTGPYTGDYPVGERSWTLFLNSKNFKGPLAYYLPETWAKISEGYPFDNGRGLDSRPSTRSAWGGTMEINTVPKRGATDSQGIYYTKIPRLQFPVDDQGRTILSKDVTFYSREAVWDKVADWKNGGEAPSGLFSTRGSYKPSMSATNVTYTQDGKIIKGITSLPDPAIFYGNDFGLKWSGEVEEGMAYFPQYFKDSADYRVAVPASEVPASTRLIDAIFLKPNENPSPYHAELQGAWRTPGPVAGPYFAYLKDGSMAVYFWYRFIDQPVFQQFNWSESKKDSLQQLVEAMHENWTPDQTYMKDPTSGELVAFDTALFVTPPSGYEKGYVPIVVRQEKSDINNVDLIKDPGRTGIEVFPNPVRNTLYVKLSELPGSSPSLMLVNMTGEVVQTFEVRNMSRILDVSFLPDGAYFLVLTDGKQYNHARFVKVK
jgi:hypothetical protein